MVPCAYMINAGNGPYCIACGSSWWDGHYCGTGAAPSHVSTASTISNVGYAQPITEPGPASKPPQPRMEKLRSLATFPKRPIRPLTLSRGVLPKARGDC